MIPGSGILICCKMVRLPSPIFLGLLCGSACKESACNAGDLGSAPGFGRSPGEGKGCPLQYSCLQNSMDPIVYGVAKSQTRLKDLSLHFQVIAPESKLDWGLPVPSGVSFLKPAKTHTLAFAGSPLSPLDRKPAWFHELTDKQEGSPANDFPPVSGGASRPQQEPALPKPGLSSALFLNPVPLP